MAKKKEVIITCNATNVKAVIEGLERGMAALAKEEEKLLNVIKQRGYAEDDEKKRLKELEKAMDAMRTNIQKNREEQKKLGEVMKDLAGAKLKDLKKALQEGKAALNNMSERDPKRLQLVNDLKRIQAQIEKNTGAINKQSSALKTTLKNLVAYAGVFAIFGKIQSTLSELIVKNKQLSDSMANVRKVTQWTSADVEKLTNNLAKIDTRNTIETLQNLAYQGAKLGIGQYGVEGLTGFVKAAEQVQTALGEDLGEEALPALAKLTEVMGLIPKFGVEQAMQKAGSAIYQLGASSTATGKNIVEFSKRLMGLANVSGITADELLGLGSAADSMALMPEVAATAFNKLFNSIQSNTAGIAKAVGVAKEELQGLIYEGKTMEALVMVFEKMQNMSMAELEGRGVFKELGSDGARLTNVMVTMSNKVDMLKDHLKVSNEAFSEGRAVINEYMIQQETAAAYFERAANIWTKAFVNPEGVDIVKQLAQEWYNTSYEMTHSASTMVSIRTTLELLAGTVKMLIQYLPTLVKLMMFYGVGNALQTIAIQFKAIYSAATLAGTATARLNALLKTNAIAVATTAVLMLAAKIYELCEASKAAAEAEEKRKQVFSDAAAEALQTYNNQKSALDKYTDALKKTNVAEDERNEIINKFKSEFGSYLEKLGIEINTYQDMEDAIHRVNKELKDKAYYETGQKLKSSYVGEAKSEQTNALSQYMQVSSKYGLSTKLMEDIVEGNVKTIEEAMERTQKEAPQKLSTWQKLRDYTTDWKAARYNQESTTGNDVFDFVLGTAQRRVTQQTEDIYNAVNNLINSTKKVTERNKQVDDFINQYAEDYTPTISVEGAILNLKKLSDLTEEKLNEGLSVLRDRWKEMTENDRKNDQQGIKGAIDKYSAQLRKMRGEGYTPPPTKKELTEAQKKEKAFMKDEMEQAEKDSTAVINAIEEFYRLQESAVEQLVADGKMTREEADKALAYVRNRKDEMLMNARRAIAGKESNFESLRKTMGQDMLRPNDVNSQRALNTVQTIDVQEAAKKLQRFDGSKNVYDLNAGSFTQAMLKNAAQNELNIQRRQAAIQQEVDKILIQYEYVEQAQRDFGDKLVKMGLITDGYQKVVQQLVDGTEVVANTRDVQALANKTVKMDSLQFYGVDEDDALELRNMIDALMHTVDEDGKKIRESFASMFPNLDEWMKYPEQYLEQMQAFYKTLIDMDADYYKALKQNYEQEKREFGERWQAMGWEAQERQENTAFETQDSLRKISGQGENFGQTYGFADEIADDPEIARIKNRMEWRARELEDLQARNASEELIMEKQNEMLKEAAALAEKVSAEVAERVGKIQTLSEPLESWGEEVGTMLGEMWQGISRDGKLTFGQMAKNMGIEYAKLTLKMASENLMKKLQQNLFYKQMEMAEMKHQAEMTTIETGGELGRMAAQTSIGTTALGVKAGQDAAEVSAEGGKASIMTMFGISEGAAKIIGKLGFWGIPLIGVITALLMGLLNSAKSTAGTESAKASNTPKVKLASGMLTYKKGNVQRFIGQDGKVYTATEEPQPKDGLVTHPIATTVQGQPALVAEDGPEIVVGRETTRAIMMNEPELIKYLANYEKYGGKTGYATARGMATFDGGNVEQVAAAISPQTSDSAEREALRHQMKQMQEVMSGVLYYLQHPVRPKINMYSQGGEDGLYDSMKKATAFMGKYGG